jgi:hypothetical protein
VLIARSRITNKNQREGTLVKVLAAVVAMLAVSATFAHAAKRHQRRVVHHSGYNITSGADRFQYDLCSPAARARDPLMVCFAGRHPSYLGRDPDSHIRFELMRDWTRGVKRQTNSDTMFGAH